MEPEGSLPYSQVPATCPFPEPARSSPYLHIPLPKDPSYYYPPIYVWVFQAVSFPQVSQPKPCMHFSSLLYVLHALPITLFYYLITQIIFGEQYRSLSSSLCSFLHSSVTSSPLGQNKTDHGENIYYFVTGSMLFRIVKVIRCAVRPLKF